MLVTVAVYWSGLYGSWLFDDYPNIVDNTALQIHHLSIPNLAGAALSSPASEFKRPLASLTFALNYYFSGLDPFAMKLTNVAIHLLNGLLIFILTGMLLRIQPESRTPPSATDDGVAAHKRIGLIAALVASAWMLLPINLTAVLYTVQRMESLANLFVIAGLVGYVAGRNRMLRGQPASGLCLAALSLVLATGIGFLAKETAVMLPLYAFLIEWILYRFGTPRRADQSARVSPRSGASRRIRHASTRHPADTAAQPEQHPGPTASETTSAQPDRRAPRLDWRIIALFLVVLVLPLIAGLALEVPAVLHPGAWASRDYTLGQRLLSEMRIVMDYIGWTLVPTPDVLSFYHDDFAISTGLFSPWTTATSALGLIALIAAIFALRRRAPLVSLGLAFFLGCQLLTGTILPLELIYEHRNYFASFGLMLALVPWLASGHARLPGWRNPARNWFLPRHVLLVGLLALWTGLTALTAYAWGNPLRLAQTLAARNPQSPRAQYGLGRRYIMYSNYNPDSVFTNMAYTPLEKAMRLPDFSVLPEQALIFMNARMHLPLKAEWWNSMDRKLRTNPLGVQDVSALASLAKCQRDGDCKLPKQRMVQAFLAALSHPKPGGRLLAIYADYAWNVLDDKPLGLRMAKASVHAAPDEPNYYITLVRMLIVLGENKQAHQALEQLKTLNIGGRLDGSIANLQALLESR